ncbi:MAG: hypothetical protein DMG07_20945 [Acidobacteria bacterium]|nr:MAG: hypothetical protein DMG07_20945 [Acidobacteriota bacterium]
MSSVGSCLREMRVNRGVSLEEVARSTRVTSHYLAALESDDFSALPPPVFTRGFIRAYWGRRRRPGVPDHAPPWMVPRPMARVVDEAQCSSASCC